MKKQRKTKYVVWLHNHTDRRDDDWRSVWATSHIEAAHLVKGVDFNRFSISHTWTIKEFHIMYPGLSA